MIGAAAACRPEGPLELHWDKVCVLSTIGPATIACYEPKRRDLNLNPRRFRLTYVGVCPMAALTTRIRRVVSTNKRPYVLKNRLTSEVSFFYIVPHLRRRLRKEPVAPP